MEMDKGEFNYLRTIARDIHKKLKYKGVEDIGVDDMISEVCLLWTTYKTKYPEMQRNALLNYTQKGCWNILYRDKLKKEFSNKSEDYTDYVKYLYSVQKISVTRISKKIGCSKRKIYYLLEN
jgi:hypothetical protein